MDDQDHADACDGGEWSPPSGVATADFFCAARSATAFGGRPGPPGRHFPRRFRRRPVFGFVFPVEMLLAAIPSAIHDTFETGRVYLFSREFLEKLPQRFTGPGRFRFVLQPVMAILLGWRDGRADARAGRPAYLYGLLVSGEKRKELVRSGWSTVRDLVAMGIIPDAVAQLLIYRQVHPGAALVVGPVLITLPYAMSRALTNRVARRMGGGPNTVQQRYRSR